MSKRTFKVTLLTCLVLVAMLALSLLLATERPTATAATPEATEAMEATEEASAAEEISLESIKTAIDLADKAARGESADYTGASGKTVGVVMPAFDNDGWVAIYIGVLAKAIETETSITTLNAQNSVDRQVAMIEDLITRQVDAIVFVPVDSAALSVAVVRANDAGIPIIALDRSTEAGTEDALIESDNRAHGAKAAELLAAVAEEMSMAVGDLKVLELLGDQATSAGVERHEGFADKAEALGIPILTALPTNWDAAKANAAVLDAFQANPDINTIYMASGCAMYAGADRAPLAAH